ncbi:MAG: hypothetical protein U0491_02570 [Candidatus Saccharimonadales bacterium]
MGKTVDDFEVLTKILDLYASRDDLDLRTLGKVIDQLFMANYPRFYDDDHERERNGWFFYLLEHGVRGRAALEVSCAMFKKFETEAQGVEWLNSVPEGMWLTRLERIKEYSAQEVLPELRGMVTASI